MQVNFPQAPHLMQNTDKQKSLREIGRHFLIF